MIHRHGQYLSITGDVSADTLTGSRYPTPNSLPLKFSEKLSTAVKANTNSDDAIGFNGELAFVGKYIIVAYSDFRKAQ